MISVERSKKGKLLDLIESNQAENHKGFTPTGDAPIPSYALSDGKDTKLLSILQIVEVKKGKTGRHPSNRSVSASRRHLPFYKDLLAHVQGGK